MRFSKVVKLATAAVVPHVVLSAGEAIPDAVRTVVALAKCKVCMTSKYKRTELLKVSQGYQQRKGPVIGSRRMV
jgi:hypothetical protein